MKKMSCHGQTSDTENHIALLFCHRRSLFLLGLSHDEGGEVTEGKLYATLLRHKINKILRAVDDFCATK